MVNRNPTLILFFLLAPVFVKPAYTQEYLYKRYEDRKEGILRERRLVAGERLELISAAIAPQEAQTETKPERYHLAFFMEDSGRAQVFVQALVPQIQRLYKMEPIFTKYPQGLRTFSWPATIPIHYNLPLDKLLPLAKLRGVAGGKIVPVLLYCRANRNATPSYRFCVVPSGGVSALNYHIYANNANTPLFSATLRDLPGDQQAFLGWAGRNQTGAPVRNGWYKLVIQATFNALPGTNPRTVTAQYDFYHYTEIFRMTGATQ